MRSKRPLPLLLSVVLHIVLLLGLFLGAGSREQEAAGFVVELVSLQPAGSAPSLLTGEGNGASDLIPPRPALLMGSKATLASTEEEDLPPPDPSSDRSGEEPLLPVPDPEDQRMISPEETNPPSDPPPPSPDGTEAPSPEERSEAEPESGFRLVAEVDRFEKLSAGTVAGDGSGFGSSGRDAPRPTVGDALPGGIGGVAGGGTAPRFLMPSADGRSHPKPRYPESARDEGREGTALLKVTVLPTGKVGEAMIERSSGHADLDQAAVEAVMKWSFLPARRGETPVSASIRIPVTFSLDRP